MKLIAVLLVLGLTSGCQHAIVGIAAAATVLAASYDLATRAQDKGRRDRHNFGPEENRAYMERLSRESHRAELGNCGVTVRRIDARAWYLDGCVRTLQCEVEGEGYKCLVVAEDASLLAAAPKVKGASGPDMSLQAVAPPPPVPKVPLRASGPVQCKAEGEWSVCVELPGP